MQLRSNAVRLARCILWAAGFKSVLIATGDGSGGYCDVEDSGYRWRNAVSVNRGLLRKVIRAEVGGP
jgi:hypothetical protein